MPPSALSLKAKQLNTSAILYLNFSRIAVGTRYAIHKTKPPTKNNKNIFQNTNLPIIRPPPDQALLAG